MSDELFLEVKLYRFKYFNEWLFYYFGWGQAAGYQPRPQAGG